MADTFASINVKDGLRVDRKLEIHLVNVGTSDSPDWEVLGRGVEDAAMAFNHDVSQVVDILGISDVDVSGAKPQLDLDPYNIRGGQKLSAMLLDIERRNAVAELSAFEILNVHAFLGQTGSFLAEVHKNCTIVPVSLGGSSYVGMPLNVHMSNDKTLGTASQTEGVWSFSKTTT